MTSIDYKPEKKIAEFLSGFYKNENYKILPLAGDASNRKYHRIIFNEQSWVLMEWEPFEDNKDYPFLSVLNQFHKCSINTPKVVAKSPEKGLILLEDLGDLTLERKFWEMQDQKNILPYYKLAIDELLKVHFTVTAENGGSTAFNMAFDTEKLLWEMNYGHKNLFLELLKIEITEEDNEKLKSIYTSICETLSNRPRFVCHRDYHSRNLMLKMGKMYLIDFQDARMGPIQYDLVSLIHDSYVNLNEDIKNKIIDYYLENAESKYDQKIDRDNFYQTLDIQTIQRCFKACGSFSSFWVLRKDQRYIKYIRPTLKTVAKHLEKNKDHQFFLDFLHKHNIIERDYLKLCMD